MMVNEEIRRALLLRYQEAYETRDEEQRRARECARRGNTEGARLHQLNRQYMDGVLEGLIEAAEAFGVGFEHRDDETFELIEITD